MSAMEFVSINKSELLYKKKTTITSSNNSLIVILIIKIPAAGRFDTKLGSSNGEQNDVELFKLKSLSVDKNLTTGYVWSSFAEK
jgi:hypothetical protein